MRRKMGYSKGARGATSASLGPEGALASDRISEDNEALPVKSGKKSIRFGANQEFDFDRDEKDTPPTRSRSRKGRGVSFNEANSKSVGSLPLKSALANGNQGSRSTSAAPRNRSEKSRSVGRSQSGMRSGSGVRRQQALFDPPKFASSGDTRLDAFEAKFEKYRSNKRAKDQIEKRFQTMK